MKMKLFKTRKDKQIKALEQELSDLFVIFQEMTTIVEEAYQQIGYWEELADYLGDYLADVHDEDVIRLINDWEYDKQ